MIGGDIDNDGDYDLIICAIGGAERTYLNNGSGTFTLGTRIISPVNESSLDVMVADLDSDRRRAMARAVGFLEAGGDPRDLFRMARRRIFLKGRDSHDYKFGAAAFEEFELAADDRWKKTLAAAILNKVPAASVSDSPLMRRAREAVAGA